MLWLGKGQYYPKLHQASQIQYRPELLMPYARSRFDLTWSTGYFWSPLIEKDKLKMELVQTRAIRIIWCAILWAQVAVTWILPNTSHVRKIKWSDPKDLMSYCFSVVRIISWTVATEDGSFITSRRNRAWKNSCHSQCVSYRWWGIWPHGLKIYSTGCQ